MLRDARELAWRRHGVAATLQLVAGDPPQAIIAAATDAHADVLVIGARRSARFRGRQRDDGSRPTPLARH